MAIRHAQAPFSVQKRHTNDDDVQERHTNDGDVQKRRTNGVGVQTPDALGLGEKLAGVCERDVRRVAGEHARDLCHALLARYLAQGRLGTAVLAH